MAVGHVVARLLASRQDAANGDANNPGSQLLDLLQDPYSQQLQSTALWSALATSFGFTVVVALGFSIVRPHNSIVYAPKLKHADEEHAPPPIGKGLFAWVAPLWNTNETDFIRHAGLDAAIFMRFTKMLRNMFLVLSVIGCGILLPVYYAKTPNVGDADEVQTLMRLTPSGILPDAVLAIVVIAYLFNIVICFFLWWNYRKVLQLRRNYFESKEYQYSLHARTLMLNDIPKGMSTDEGIARIIDEVAPESSFSRTAMARNVKHLPELIRQHSDTVRSLEKVLAKYLKDPKNLPAARPVCLPNKKDPSFGTYPKGQKVDAIEYLTQRIKELELEITEARQQVDKRSTLPYGFASYDDISEAHSIAYTVRNKSPQGTTIVLAPRPNDIIWDNMPLGPKARSWRRTINNFWIALLTVVWIVPNAFIAVFLTNLNNIGKLSKPFQTELQNNFGFWSVVQGVASPAITSLIYLVLPIIFRRLSMRAGDRTKTGRERHVVAKLFSFFVFNNLVVFSLFSAVFGFVQAVVKDTDKGDNAWTSIIRHNFGQTLFVAMCQTSAFWITWLLQRNLGAAIDLSQLWPLIYSSFMRKFSSPTPRELIELTAPPPFDYTSYYNYFLFYAAVAFSFSVIQPLVLPAALIYFAIDVWLKKYMLLYVFVTKTESGGAFWRILFNRLIFGAILSNLVVFLTVWCKGAATHELAFAVIPLPFLVFGFKIYCSRMFDDKMHFYSTQNIRQHVEARGQKDRNRSDRLAARFGHPALYKPLITPMVHAKAQNILAAVYKGRLTDGRSAGSGDGMSVSGYSDAYALDSMSAGKPGKPASMPGFELVTEGRMDFEYYKNRPEWASEHGGGGELYGKYEDMRPGTPGSMWNGSDSSRPASPGLPGRAASPGFMRSASPAPMRSASPGPGANPLFAPTPQRVPTMPNMGGGNPSPYSSPGPEMGRTRSPLYATNSNNSATNLASHAAAMPVGTPAGGMYDRAPGEAGMLGGGPMGYGGLPQDDTTPPSQYDPTQVDYFRAPRPRRNDTGGH